MHCRSRWREVGASIGNRRSGRLTAMVGQVGRMRGRERRRDPTSGPRHWGRNVSQTSVQSVGRSHQSRSARATSGRNRSSWPSLRRPNLRHLCHRVLRHIAKVTAFRIRGWTRRGWTRRVGHGRLDNRPAVIVAPRLGRRRGLDNAVDTRSRAASRPYLRTKGIGGRSVWPTGPCRVGGRGRSIKDGCQSSLLSEPSKTWARIAARPRVPSVVRDLFPTTPRAHVGQPSNTASMPRIPWPSALAIGSPR
jgi:hypothetical protein